MLSVVASFFHRANMIWLFKRKSKISHISLTYSLLYSVFIYLFIYFLISCWVKKTSNIACVAGGILVTRGYRVSREASGEAERSREGKCIHTSRGSAAKTSWFSNRTGTSVDNGARKSNNCLTNGWAANWAPEVEFSPFRALSRRQMKFPFYC